MPRKRLGAEQIIPKLREAQVDLAKGLTVGQVCKKIGVTEQTYYCGREEHVEKQRTKVDWARQAANLLPARYARADKVILVCDNLNTPTKGAFYEAYVPEQARAIVRCPKFCYTPKHGSWLNIAENELSSLSRPCLKGRRLGDIELMQSETTAWHQASNPKQRVVDGHFRIADACQKLEILYLKILV